MRKIDAVITWVDGNDPVHRAKRIKYGSTDILTSEDVAGETRFNSLGEIFWCVASLNRFAPWLNKIYIVTDEQDPHLDDFLNQHFPSGHIPVEIIDHCVIFRGYEQHLPTFNSIALETITWRIPGLSEYFIELNDDLMLMNAVTPDDFFTDNGNVVCYATKSNMAWTWFTRKLKPKINGRTKVTFKGNMLNAAKLINHRTFFLKLDHTPKALRRSIYEEYFNQHPQAMETNISHRFRNAAQFTSQELQYLILYNQNKCKLLPSKSNLFYLQPKKGKPGYVKRKLDKFKKDGNRKFACLNSLDFATPADREAIIAWITDKLDLK